MASRGLVLGTAAVSLAALLAVLGQSRNARDVRASQTAPEERPLTVDVIVARVQPMPVVLQAVGQVVSEHSVQLRPQVAGMLKDVLFVEGRPVTAGQHLFRIEPASFEAALAAARASWQSTKENADRMETLVQQHYVVPQDYRNARAAAAQAEAAYQQALINLAYTDLRAPISGRAGSLSVKAGNIISPADPAPLVTINQMQPIQVQFNIPQQLLPDVVRHRSQHAVSVTVAREEGHEVLDEGELVFIDNTVNVSSGTVMLKARLPNKREQLWPGQYVGVSLQLTVEPNAVVVEQTALQAGQQGSFVYVVDGGRARARNVKVDRQVGDLSVISSGLHGKERVIARVPRNLRSGMRVTPADPAPAPAAEVTLSSPE
jgi:membrane fusion protein, multidrug efflux system